MKIIITGSSGFVGSNFIKINSNHHCIGVDLINVKVNDIAFSNIDSVLHLAALVHQMKGAPEEHYYKVNRDLAFDVAKRAKEQGVKHFILMSTVKVYGESTAKQGYWNEESECIPTDPYGKSKFEAEKLIRNLEDDSFKVAIVRSPLVYGAGVTANMFNLIKLIDKIPFLPFGNINNSRSIVYIGNLVALLQHIIVKQASGVFIASDKTPISTSELVKTIAHGLGKQTRLFKMPNWALKIIGFIKPGLVDRLYGSLVLNNLYTTESLQFTPPFTTEVGILEMVNWYKSLKDRE